MTMWANNGAWVGSTPYAKFGGVWVECDVYAKEAGVWKTVYLRERLVWDTVAKTVTGERAFGQAEVSIQADTDGLFNLILGTGTASTGIDDNGDFPLTWHSEQPSPSNLADFRVNANLISGPAPTGAASNGTWLNMESGPFTWTVTDNTTGGGLINTVLDVTFENEVSGLQVTKRITMGVNRNDL